MSLYQFPLISEVWFHRKSTWHSCIMSCSILGWIESQSRISRRENAKKASPARASVSKSSGSIRMIWTCFFPSFCSNILLPFDIMSHHITSHHIISHHIIHILMGIIPHYPHNQTFQGILPACIAAIKVALQLGETPWRCAANVLEQGCWMGCWGLLGWSWKWLRIIPSFPTFSTRKIEVQLITTFWCLVGNQGIRWLLIAIVDHSPIPC